MVGMIVNGQADMIVAPLTQTSLRDTVIDFTIPLEREITTCLAPVSKTMVTHFWVYMEIFPIISWVVGIIAILALSGLLYAISIAKVEQF